MLANLKAKSHYTEVSIMGLRIKTNMESVVAQNRMEKKPTRNFRLT